MNTQKKTHYTVLNVKSGDFKGLEILKQTADKLGEDGWDMFAVRMPVEEAGTETDFYSVVFTKEC